MRFRHLSLLPLLSSLLFPNPLLSQQADSVALLRELAVILATGGSLDAVLRLGQAPASLPPEAIDPTARILGSLDQGSSSRTVFLVTAFPDSVRSGLEARLQKAGWVQPDNPFSRAGFVNPQMSLSDHLCRKDEMLMPMIMTREARQSLVVLLHTKGNGGECSPTARYLHTFDPRPMPRLFPAFDMPIEGGGAQQSMTGWYSTATLTTHRPINEIMSHYAGQLERAG